MTRDEVIAALIDIVTDQMAVEEGECDENTSLHDDLEIDSLDTLQLSTAVEYRFGIVMGDHDFRGADTLGDVADRLLALMGEDGKMMPDV